MSVPRRLNRAWRSGQAAPRERGWRAQEERATELQPGGRTIPGSGSGEGASRKSDGTGDIFRVSAKTTGKKSLSIKRAWLEEITAQARNAGQAPLLVFGFDSDGSGRLDWAAFPHHVAQALIACAVAAAAGDIETARAQAELVVRS